MITYRLCTGAFIIPAHGGRYGCIFSLEVERLAGGDILLGNDRFVRSSVSLDRYSLCDPPSHLHGEPRAAIGLPTAVQRRC